MRKSYKFGKRKRNEPEIKYRANLQINVPMVFVIDETGATLGQMTTRQALTIAEERGYDLVEVSPNAQPPVVKLLNLGSFQYHQTKLAKQQKKNQKSTETKGIRLSLKIAQGDMETKARQAEKFLEKGNKAKIELILRGRELQKIDIAKEIIKNFLAQLKTPYSIEQETSKQGNKLFIIITPKENV
ncbi:translation initiation factor IF-3 [Candidatus Falkowbacteria bacterium]|nr:translation initiation factor IF-3 [Candidatus Falkowbacteria bacterium]